MIAFFNFRDEYGGSSSKNCINCPAGFYCGKKGLDDTSGPCSERYLCKGGSSSPTPENSTTGHKCSMGFYCKLGAIGGEQLRCNHSQLFQNGKSKDNCMLVRDEEADFIVCHLEGGYC